MPLRISPFSSVKANTLSNFPFKCGWFLIQFLTTLSSTQFKQFQIRYNLTLETRHQINSYSYEQYLTYFQIEQLSNEPLIKLTPLIKDIPTRKLNAKPASSNKCLIRSIPKWSPLDSSIFYRQISSDIYVVNISCSKLINDKRIKSLNKYKSRNFLNRYITGFLQSGSEKGVFENGSYVSPHPLFEIGIHGEDQIISVTDTGVDVLHNFFYDSRYNKIQVNKTYPDHRKIYAYYSTVDSSDGEEGHGTHVSGIALGEALDTDSSISLYNGMAPKAKLFFLDLGDSNYEDDLSGEFDGNEIYKIMSNNGVSICSNSWGFNTSFDNQIMTVEYDKFAYENPEMLFLFAAGNEGSDDDQAQDANLYYTVNSPGDSKNCLSIGSTSNTVLSSIEEERDWTIEIDGKNRIEIEPETFGTDPWDSNIGNPKLKQSNLSIHFYNQASSADIESFKDTIVFLENDKENFCNNAKKVANKGATAIIHVLDYSLPECTDNSKILKSIKQSKNSERSFKNSKHKSNKRKINKSKLPDFEYDFGFSDFDEIVKAPVFSIVNPIDQNSKLASLIPEPTNYFKNDKMKLSYFSSLGPSFYGINKPDIVVPGEYIISAAAGSPRNKNPLPATYDTLMINSGTSMATPAAAGLASLVRQFFTQGFYPSRTSSTDDSKHFKNITSTFIRAVLINSANPFDIDSSVFTSTSGPNIRTGFGLPNISNTLLSSPLRVVPNSQIKSSDKHVYPLNVQYKNNTELKVTMSFLDPPLSEDSATTLFADLDLHIVSPSGRLYTGNGYKNNQTEMSNTIERIIIPSDEIEIGLYKIIVTSNDFEDSLVEKINYSIVVNGPFNHFDFDSNPSILKISQEAKKCEIDCKSGTCDLQTGKCKCDADHVGFDCSSNIIQLNIGQQFSPTLIPNEIIYVKIPLGFYNDNEKPTIISSIDKSDQIYKIFVSDSQFTSFSDPGVFSIIADGSQKIEVPLTLTGTDEEIKNSVIYVAFITNAPTNLKLDFKLSTKNPDPYLTPEPTESKPNPPDNYEHKSIENSEFIGSMFLFLVFFSALLIISSIVYIVVLIYFRIRARNQPVLA